MMTPDKEYELRLVNEALRMKPDDWYLQSRKAELDLEVTMKKAAKNVKKRENKS